MRKYFLLISIVLLFTACENKRGEFKCDDGYKFLSTLNVGDAKMIYRKSATKSEENDIYWKVDFSGKEVQLLITGFDGQNHNIGIASIVKLSNRILLLQPNVIDIISLLPGYDNNATISIPVGLYLMIVDVKTEKLYKWPSEIHFRTLAEGVSSVSDGSGNVYFTIDQTPNKPRIYKLDITDFTMQSMLPDGDTFTDFTVTADGFLVYWDKHNGNYKVKCPGSRLYPITGKAFCLKNNIYSLEDSTIYLWKSLGNNSLEKKEICIFKESMNEEPILRNLTRKTVLFRDGRSGGIVEFDGDQISEPFTIPEEFYNMANNNKHHILYSNKAWYIINAQELHKLDMTTYQNTKITILDYEIQSITSDENSSDLKFTGIRYSDGANVAGILSGSDEIVIDQTNDSGNKIYDLISIN